MKTFTTLFDVNYLDRGIALYESIDKFINDYRLYCLCIDDITFNKIKEINDAKLIPICIGDEFHNSEDFKILVKYNESVPITTPADKCERPGRSPFHFALASFFAHYIMEKESPEDIVRIDSDVIFYTNPDLLFDAMKGKSIGIIMHRHNKVGVGVGGYNAGLVYFRNDEIGRKCLKWWRDVVLDKSNKWFRTHGYCTEQKYIELFEPMFGNVRILDDDIGHAAPWNFRLYTYFDDPTIIKWKGKIQPLVFIHFSQFNYTKKSYRVEREKEWKEFPPAKRYNEEYFEILKSVKVRYKL